jgi:hypothetical protein
MQVILTALLAFSNFTTPLYFGLHALLGMMGGANSIIGGQPFVNSSPDKSMSDTVQTLVDGTRKLTDIVVRFPWYTKAVRLQRVYPSLEDEAEALLPANVALVSSVPVLYYNGIGESDPAVKGEVRVWSRDVPAAGECFERGLRATNELTALTKCMRPDPLHAVLNEALKRFESLNQLGSAVDERNGRPRSAVDDSLKHLSLQFQFWSAVSAIPCLERVVSRLENRVLRDVAKVDGKAFDKSKPVDYRFIGDQTSAVSCNLVALLIIVISNSSYSTHHTYDGGKSQVYLGLTDLTAPFWSFFSSLKGSEVGKFSVFYNYLLAIELSLHYGRQIGALYVIVHNRFSFLYSPLCIACRLLAASYSAMYTLRVDEISRLIALGQDYMALLTMFNWRTGSNEFQFGIVIPNMLNKVSRFIATYLQR